ADRILNRLRATNCRSAAAPAKLTTRSLATDSNPHYIGACYRSGFLAMAFKAEGDQVRVCGAMGDILNRIGDKWSVMVVGHLTRKTMRFNELRHAIGGISQRMLTLTLRNLERDGLVTRTVYPE